MICFLILLVRRTWFGQIDELYFVLNWIIITNYIRQAKVRPVKNQLYSKPDVVVLAITTVFRTVTTVFRAMLIDELATIIVLLTVIT